MKIERIIGREIYDSQGWPALQCELFLDDGRSVVASVPSGNSVGVYEAVELRDGGERLGGRGLLKAIEHIEHSLAPLLVGKEPQALEMDLKMVEFDGTPDKSRLGANTLLAVSIALYKAQALIEECELYELFAGFFDAETVSMPFPLLNVINGGAHADNNLRIQEFMLMPVGAQTFRSSFEVGVLVFHELGDLLKKRGKSTAVGLEGGYACNFTSEREALDILLEAIEHINKRHTLSCVIALDVAASQFYDVHTGLYTWHDQQFTSDDMINYYTGLVAQYPIYSIEDGLAQEDWKSWIKLTKALEQKAQIVGDDLFVTDVYRIALGAEDHAATSVIIKPNQVGTVAETLQAIALCKSQGLHTIVSHRSAETEDTFIADLAVGTSAGQIKAGSCCRSERVAKYNRLLMIEDQLTFSQFDH